MQSAIPQGPRFSDIGTKVSGAYNVIGEPANVCLRGSSVEDTRMLRRKLTSINLYVFVKTLSA